MAITLVGSAGAGYQRGITDNEGGINVEEVMVEIEPEYREPLNDKVNVVICWAVAPPKITVTIKGEINDPADFPATDFVTPATVANSVDYMGVTGYDLFATNTTVTQGRAAWFNMDQKLEGSSGVSA